MPPKKIKKLAPLNLKGLPKEAVDMLRTGRGLSLKSLATKFNVKQAKAIITEADPSADLKTLSKEELAAELIRQAVKRGVNLPEAMLVLQEQPNEEANHDPDEEPWTCSECRDKPPGYIFDVCHCLGVCTRCRAEMLWGSDVDVPYSAEDILACLRCSCPRCGTRHFGRDVKRVNRI